MATNLHSETENVHVFPSLDQVPNGLRVLVVDDDVTSLIIIEKMAIQCNYHVTTCTEASVALNLLRERKGCFDVVLSDVYMPGMDGFEFLQHVDQEFKVPVVMMSADESTSTIMEGMRQGACYYLVKPLQEEDLKNIWQHVISKTRRNQDKEHQNKEHDPNKRVNVSPENTYSVNIEANEGIIKDQKKRSLSTERGDVVDDNPSTPKKQRFVWSQERHQIFVNAVLQLGIDKAVPKRILELMNIPDLTRENVASHLQKYRLHMKKKSEEIQQKTWKRNGTIKSKLDASGRFDSQALAHAGHVCPQTQADLHAEFTGSPAGCNKMPKEDQVPLLKSSSVQEPNHSHAQPCALSNCDSNIANNFPQPITAVPAASSGYGAWEWPQSNAIGSVGLNSGIGRMGAPNGNVLMNILQQHQMQEYRQRQQRMQLQQSLMHNQIHPNSINIQPSYLMAPSQPSETLQVGNSLPCVNHSYSFGRNSLTDYSTFSPQMNNSLSIAEFPGGYTSSLASISPPVFCSRTHQLPNSTLAFGDVKPFPSISPVSGTQVPYGSRSIDSLHQGQVSIENRPNFSNSSEVNHPA